MILRILPLGNMNPFAELNMPPVDDYLELTILQFSGADEDESSGADGDV